MEMMLLALGCSCFVRSMFSLIDRERFHRVVLSNRAQHGHGTEVDLRYSMLVSVVRCSASCTRVHSKICVIMYNMIVLISLIYFDTFRAS